MAFPYAQVRGILAVPANDGGDENSDLTPVVHGEVIFTPLLNQMKLIPDEPHRPVTAGTSEIVCTLDGEGNITHKGQPFVNLLDLGSDQINPRIPSPNATYKVVYRGLKTADLQEVRLPTSIIRPLAGVENDLTLMLPVVEGTPFPLVEGPQGEPGYKGWSPVVAIVADGTRRVLQIIDWAGGEGEEPSVVDQFIGPVGIVNSPAQAVDVRGSQGGKGDRGDIGPVGPAGKILEVLAQSLPAGSEPTIVNEGTQEAAEFVFGIPRGDKGDVGPIGPIGHVPGIRMKWSASTSIADPGNGFVRINAAGTSMAISELYEDGSALPSGFFTFVTAVNGTLTIMDDDGNYIAAAISGMTDNGSWRTFTLVPVAQQGVLADGVTVSINNSRQGNVGATGASPGFKWTYVTNNTVSDPGAGNFKMGAGYVALALSKIMLGNSDVSGLGVYLNPGKFVMLGNQAGAFRCFRIDEVIDNGTWWRLNVTPLGDFSTLASGVTVSFLFSGDGPTGQTGPSGLGAPASGYPILATNGIANPTAAVNITGYGAGGQNNSNLTRDTVLAPNGCVRAESKAAGPFAIVNTSAPVSAIGEQWSVTFRAWFPSTGITNPAIQVFGATAKSITVTEFDKWVTYTIPVTATNVNSASVGAVATADGPGRLIYMDDVQVTKGTTPWPYFDGSTPGARWVGTAHASASELITPRSLDLVYSARDSVRYIEGNGSPIGKIDAPIGVHYVDLDKTNGAIEWISNAPGVNGWGILYGDTGVRDVKALVASGFTASVMRLIREGDDCILWYANIGHAAGFSPASGWQTLLALPVGYRGRGSTEFESQGTVPSSPPLRQRISVGSAMLLGTVGAGTANLTGSFVWKTTDPWPTTLPGAAS